MTDKSPKDSENGDRLRTIRKPNKGFTLMTLLNSQHLGPLLSQMSELIHVRNASGDLVWANPSAAELFGWPATDPNGEIAPATDDVKFALDQATSTGSWKGTLRRLDVRGNALELESRWSSVSDPDGSLVGFMVWELNIEDRGPSENKLKSYLDAAPDAIVVVSTAGRIILANQQSEVLLGYTLDELLTMSVDDLVPMDVRDAHHELREFFHDSPSGRQLHTDLNIRAQRKDGTIVPVEIALSPIESEDGFVVVAALRDITEHLKAERVVRESEKNLLRAQRMESISTLAGGIAHDINNVLGPILIAAEMIRRKTDDPWIQKKMECVETSARRGAEIVKQVLDFSRGMDGEKIAVQIRHVLKELLEFAGHTFSKSIVLEGDFPRDLPPLVGDAAQLRQGVLNMMVNARDAMPDGGTLSLRCNDQNLTAQEAVALSPQGIEGHYVRIDIEDTGPGIPDDVVDRIFEPFFTTKSRGQGSGLGLSTTLSIVQGHGGFIGVASRPGAGTTFSLFLPVAVQKSPDTSPLAAVDASPAVETAGRTILIVDDEPMMLDMNADMLESFDYNTFTAENGQVGLDLFKAQIDEIDLVITDINMPVMDGPTMIREIRNLRPDMPIMAVSGLSEVEHAKDGTGLEGVQILRKPYSTDDLLSAIRQRIGEAGAAADDEKTQTGDTMSDSAFDDFLEGGSW